MCDRGGPGGGPGGTIAETSGLTVDHCIGPLGVGALVVKPKRHVLRLSELDETEALQTRMFDAGEAPDPAGAAACAAHARLLLSG